MIRRMPPTCPDRLRRSVGAAADAAIDVLMRPRVRRVRRWAFLVTVPVAALVASMVDLRSGALVIGARAALWLAITIVAWRVGGERGEAVLDLLMHPRARALVRAETDVVLAFPRLLWAALVTRPARALRYSAGDHLPVLALAFAPPVLVEGAIVHVLVPGDWLLVHVVAGIAHPYALAWLWSWGFAPRAYPHRLARGALVARNRPLYRACVPVDAVVGAVTRRERAETAMLAGALRDALTPA